MSATSRLVLVGMLLVAGACGAQNPGGSAAPLSPGAVPGLPAVFVLSGVIRDAGTELPIDEVRVELAGGAGPFTLTDEGGGFRIEVPAGVHDVRFWKEGYVAETRQVTVGGDVSLGVTLRPASPFGTFTLSGRVLERADGAIEGARIEVIDGVHVGRFAVSRADGRFDLHGVAGDLALRVSKDGYHPATARVSIRESRQMELTLQPATYSRSSLLLTTLEGTKARRGGRHEDTKARR